MAELNNFDANIIEPTGRFDPLPLGEYSVVISSSEMKTTKSGEGQYLQLTYDVASGEFTGRKIFDRLNLVNKSEQTQEIAQRALSAICRCVGILHPKNSEELHDKPMIIKVGIRPAKDGFEESNSVKAYLRTDGKDLKDVVEGAALVAKAVPATGAKPKKPWQK